MTSLELDPDFMEINILTKFHELWIKTRVYPKFSWDSSNLVLTQNDPVSKPDLDFMEINILTKFQVDWIKTVPLEYAQAKDDRRPSQSFTNMTDDGHQISSGELITPISFWQLWDAQVS